MPLTAAARPTSESSRHVSVGGEAQLRTPSPPRRSLFDHGPTPAERAMAKQVGALHAELGVIMDVICPQGQQR